MKDGLFEEQLRVHGWVLKQTDLIFWILLVKKEVSRVSNVS